jgi:hypothetical protein
MPRFAIAAAFVVWLTAVGAALHGAEEYDSDWRWAMLLVACMAGLWVAVCLATMGRNPEPPAVQHAVGGLIRGIILVQAALVLVDWAGLNIAIALMVAFLINGLLGRVFYAS